MLRLLYDAEQERGGDAVPFTDLYDRAIPRSHQPAYLMLRALEDSGHVHHELRPDERDPWSNQLSYWSTTQRGRSALLAYMELP